jgi:hypothetical protein
MEKLSLIKWRIAIRIMRRMRLVCRSNFPKHYSRATVDDKMIMRLDEGNWQAKAKQIALKCAEMKNPIADANTERGGKNKFT